MPGTTAIGLDRGAKETTRGSFVAIDHMQLVAVRSVLAIGARF